MESQKMISFIVFYTLQIDFYLIDVVLIASVFLEVYLICIFF